MINDTPDFLKYCIVYDIDTCNISLSLIYNIVPNVHTEIELSFIPLSAVPMVHVALL